MNSLMIGGSPIGDGHPAIVISEQGINAGGDIGTAKRLVDVSVECGVNATKTQKRSVDIVYSAEELARPRESPFGTTNGDLKRGLEFSKEEYDEFDVYCKSKNMTWLSSCWDEASVDYIAQYDPPCFKIASACITDDNLLKHHLQYHKPLIISTGMTTLKQIDHAVEIVGTDNVVLMHCIGVYPCPPEHLNLRVIQTLKERYNTPVGWSGHEVGLATTVAAVAMGANMIERHITLDRASWGSDQSASVEPQGLKRLVRDIRVVESAMGDGVKNVLPEELPVAKKLRRVDTARLEG